jgi:hypothetical protein
MGVKQISYPRGEFGTPVEQHQEVATFEGVNTAITANSLVTLDFNATTGQLRVRPTTTALDPEIGRASCRERVSVYV